MRSLPEVHGRGLGTTSVFIPAKEDVLGIAEAVKILQHPWMARRGSCDIANWRGCALSEVVAQELPTAQQVQQRQCQKQ